MDQLESPAGDDPEHVTSSLFAPQAHWKMSLGERAALIGLLTVVRPSLALEIGTLTGGSLEAISATATQVHSFDLAPQVDPTAFPNVTFHVGDSHVLLPKVLSSFAAEGRNVDFVLVDGDHSEEGVLADVTDLLSSDAVGRTVILVHDVAHESVRAGLKRVDWAGFPKVRELELDAVPGWLAPSGDGTRTWWGGIGLVLVDEAGTSFGSFGGGLPHGGIEEAPDPGVRAEELSAALEASRRDADRLRHDLVALRSSLSWRSTAGLRYLAELGRRARRRGRAE